MPEWDHQRRVNERLTAGYQELGMVLLQWEQPMAMWARERACLWVRMGRRRCAERTRRIEERQLCLCTASFSIASTLHRNRRQQGGKQKARSDDDESTDSERQADL